MSSCESNTLTLKFDGTGRVCNAQRHDAHMDAHMPDFSLTPGSCDQRYIRTSAYPIAPIACFMKSFSFYHRCRPQFTMRADGGKIDSQVRCFALTPMYILLQKARSVVLSGISSIQPARGRRVPNSAKRISARTSAVHVAVNKASAESLTRKGAFDHMEHGKL